MSERTIQTIKKLIKKTTENYEDIYTYIALLAYRNTPIYNSYTPSQILMARYLRDNLPMNDNKFNSKVIDRNKFSRIITNKQRITKTNYDKKRR